MHTHSQTTWKSFILFILFAQLSLRKEKKKKHSLHKLYSQSIYQSIYPFTGFSWTCIIFCNKETGERARSASTLIKVSGGCKEGSSGGKWREQWGILRFLPAHPSSLLAAKIASAPQSQAMFCVLTAQGLFLMSHRRYGGEILLLLHNKHSRRACGLNLRRHFVTAGFNKSI